MEQLILISKIPEIPEIFSKEFQKILCSMLNKNLHYRPSAEKLIIRIREDFPQFSTFHTFKTDRILENFRQVCLTDFIQLCEFDSNDLDYYEDSFFLFSNFFRNQLLLSKNKFYHINFKKNQILLKAYSIKSGTRDFPLSWKIESKNQSNDWIIVDQQTNVEEMKVPRKEMVFNLIQPLLCSTLRITFLESTSKYYVSISQIELFGSIADDQKVLQNFIKRTQEISVEKQMTFNFDNFGHNGFFKFLALGSLNKCNDIVSIESLYSKKNSLSTNLMNWDDQNWEGEEYFGSSSFYIHFKFPWIFRLFGYRLRSGFKQFPIEWECKGINSDHGKGNWKTTVLDDQKNNFYLLENYSEKSFRIQNENFFDCFVVYLRKNSEGGREFCLNAIEIFGILREMSEEEKRLEKQRILEYQRK
jgi:hypothetical protein